MVAIAEDGGGQLDSLRFAWNVVLLMGERTLFYGAGAVGGRDGEEIVSA
jgi:hypothetical protein